MFMKKAVLAVVIAGSFVFYGHAVDVYEVGRLSLEDIDRREVEIDKSLGNENIKRTVIKGVAAAAALVVTYQLLNRFWKDGLPTRAMNSGVDYGSSLVSSAYDSWCRRLPGSQNITSKGATEVVEAVAEKASQLSTDGRLCKLEVALNLRQAPFFSWRKWNSLLASGRDQLVVMVMTRPLIAKAQEYTDKMFHEDDVRWFLLNRTTSVSLVDEVKLYAQALESVGGADSDKVAYYKQATADASTALVTQIGDVMAFMRYKAKQLPNVSERLQSELRAIEKYLIISVNKYGSHVERMLNSGDQTKYNSVDLTEYVGDLSGDLGRAIVRFGRVEMAAQCA